jgi:hypothetical protein
MSQHGSREQKKLAKKKAKREQKRNLGRQFLSWPLAVFRNLPTAPIVEALEPVELWDKGIGTLILSRRLPDGQVAAGLFLVDTWCLGIKDSFIKLQPASQYRQMVYEINVRHKARPVSPERLAKLVYQAADYARRIGFEPDSGFKSATEILGGIDPSLCTDTFDFGKDGKPFYFQGPHESATEAMAIANKVQAAGGHFVMVRGGPQGLEDDIEAIEE